MLKKVGAWLEGKKSVVVIVVGIVAGILDSLFDIQIPPEFWEALLAILGLTVKLGLNRTEKATKELLDAIKEAKKK